MKSIKRLLFKGAEGVAAAMLAAMFFTFILQIVSRYLLEEPFSWTLEVCLTLWIWLVFWGNAFIVRHDEHVTFDVIYHFVTPKTRKIFSLIASASIVIGMGVSLYPTWDYIDFLKIKKSSNLHIPMRTIFSIFAVFMVAAIISYAHRFIITVRHGVPDEHPEDKAEVGAS